MHAFAIYSAFGLTYALLRSHADTGVTTSMAAKMMAIPPPHMGRTVWPMLSWTTLPWTTYKGGM
jgi:hypothetical protein